MDSVPYRDFEMKDVARIRRKLDDKELNLAIDRNTLISKIRNLEESGIDKEEKLGSKGKKSAVVVARRSRRAIAHDIKLLTDLSYQVRNHLLIASMVAKVAQEVLVRSINYSLF